MSLYRRKASGPWWIRISVAGHRIRKSTGTADRETAEEFEAREFDRAYREYKLRDRSAIPWREAAARWLLETRKRSKDKDKYILAWFDGKLGGDALSAIDRERLEELREALIEEGSSEANVDRYMQCLRGVLRKARDEWRWLESIPKVPMYAPGLKEPRWLRRPEFERLKRELPPHLRLCAEFAVLTGLRMRSQLGLTWDRVDLRKKRAWVPMVGMKGKRTFGFPLSREAVKVLRRAKTAAPKGEHVFQYQNALGEWHSIGDCNTAAFQKAVTRAKVGPLRWHDLRHTFASWAVQGGVTLHELMQLGDWKSYQMVLRYAHLAPDHLAKAAEKVSKTGTRRKRAAKGK